jgi:hypothetical protein
MNVGMKHQALLSVLVFFTGLPRDACLRRYANQEAKAFLAVPASLVQARCQK